MNTTYLNCITFLISCIFVPVSAYSANKLRMMPFTTAKPKTTEENSIYHSLNLSKQSELMSLLRSNLRAQGLSLEVDLYEVSSSDSRIRAGFTFQDYRICNSTVTANKLSKGQITILGDIPSFDPNSTYDLEFVDISQLKENLIDALASEGINENVNFEEINECLWESEDGDLTPSHEVKIAAGNSKIRLIMDQYKVHVYEPNEFHATATSTIYENNIYGSFKSYSIPNIDASVGGYYYASNSYFTTEFADGSSRFKSTDTAFTPTASTDHFDEISLFTNANITLNWLQSIGFNDFGSNRITIVAHDTSANNALYQPSSTQPLIKVGEGDGSLLQNLSTDTDVVSHELGHHIVYQSITRINGESLVLHEGLADFFTFARTNDACLGESICPASSSFCYKANQCLRTGDNDLSYGSSELPVEPHLKSQLISGFLWDFIDKENVPNDVWAGLVLKAVKILNDNSGYQDLLLSLLVVDAAEYQGSYCSAIYSLASSRNLESLISDYSCETIYSETGAAYSSGAKISSITGTNSPSPSVTSSSSSSGFCGSIGQTSSKGAFIVLILPLLVAFRRKKD